MTKQEEATALVAKKLWELSGWQEGNDLKNWDDAQKIVGMLLGTRVMHTADADCRHKSPITDGYLSSSPSHYSIGLTPCSKEEMERWWAENYTENGIYRDAF
jgi:hypothetical protein